MAGELRATVLTAVKGDAAEKLGKQLDGLSGKLKSFGSIASKAAKGLVGIGSALVSSKFIGDSVEQAKNLERSLLGLDTIFGDLAPRMEQFSKDAANIGLSQSEAAKASVFLGSVLQQYGVESNVAADQTEKLVGLAADLAATYGYDVQESLLAMTALFRGEYDPIEKFGVAMKQNEIEAVKAARGMDKLTGAEEMNADVNIRLELLYERTAMAQGAVARGADTLYVQQEKLRATFENLQAQLGAELIPVFAELFEQLRPIIEDATPALIEVFRAVGEVISELGQLFVDIFDPTTEIGESFTALKIQLDSLWESVFGRDFDISAIFDGVEWFIGLIVDALHDLIRFIDNTVIGFKVMGEMLNALFTGDWNKLVNTDWTGQIRAQIELKDELNETRLAAEKLNAEMAKTAEVRIGQMDTYLEFLNRRAKESGLDAGKSFGEGFGEGAGEETKDIVADFWSGLTDEVEKQASRVRLEALGASEGLIGAILGAGEDWQKVFDDIVKNGAQSVAAAQVIFNKTADGIKEIEAAAKQAEEQLKKIQEAEINRAKQLASAGGQTASYYEAYARMIEAGYEKEVAIQVAREEYAAALAKRNAELIAEQRRLTNAFTASATEIFGAFEAAGMTQKLGEYGSAVEELRASLVSLVQENLFEGQTGLFSSSVQSKLISSINSVADLMVVIANARDQISVQIGEAQDELATAAGKRQSLFESIVDSIMGGVNVTQIGGNSAAIIRVLQRTLDQTRMFADQLDQLRTMGLGESAIQQIVDAGAQVGGATARALLNGGADAIGEVNRLYAEINGVAEEIGESSASAMYDAGIDTMQGLVDGLLAQEQEFITAAEYLAGAFRDSFDRAITTGRVSISAPSYSDILGAINARNMMVGVPTNVGQPVYGGSGAANITVNINPGLVTDPVGLGKEVVNAIQRYESNNGRVFVRA